jgi:hypothetical protein
VFTQNLEVGVIVNLILFVLAVVKVSAVFRALGLPLRGGPFALIMAQIALLLAMPGIFKFVSQDCNGALPALALYAVWWCVGAIVALYGVLLCGVNFAPGPRIERYAQHRGVVGALIVLGFVSILAHLCTSNWVYGVRWYSANLSPVLLGLAVTGTCAQHLRMSGLARLRATISLPILAVMLSAAYPWQLEFQPGGLLVFSPLRLALLGSAAVYVHAMVAHRQPLFGVGVHRLPDHGGTRLFDAGDRDEHRKPWRTVRRRVQIGPAQARRALGRDIRSRVVRAAASGRAAKPVQGQVGERGVEAIPGRSSGTSWSGEWDAGNVGVKGARLILRVMGISPMPQIRSLRRRSAAGVSTAAKISTTTTAANVSAAAEVAAGAGESLAFIGGESGAGVADPAAAAGIGRWGLAVGPAILHVSAEHTAEQAAENSASEATTTAAAAVAAGTVAGLSVSACAAAAAGEQAPDETQHEQSAADDQDPREATGREACGSRWNRRRAVRCAAARATTRGLSGRRTGAAAARRAHVLIESLLGIIDGREKRRVVILRAEAAQENVAHPVEVRLRERALHGLLAGLKFDAAGVLADSALPRRSA